MIRFFTQLLSLLTILSLEMAAAKSVHGARPGYVTDVEEELISRVQEVHLVVPEPPKKKDLKKVIFDAKLSKEFKHRYERDFGLSQAERNIQTPSRFDEYQYRPGENVSIEEDLRRKRQFGNFMMKRLTEHHVDQYAKSKPEFRSVYELKEKLSQMNVEVKKGYKMRFRYSYSGNYLLLRVENPYEIQTRVTMEMNPAQIGPGEVEETIISLGYPLTSSVNLLTDYKVNSGDYSFVASKALTGQMSMSLTASRAEESLKYGVEEELFLLGFTWNQ